MKKEDCIFCKVVEGKSESWTVYEDDLVKAFFDFSVASEGHTLVVPKEHYENIYDIPEKELFAIVLALKKIANNYKKTLNVKAVNIMHASGKDAQQSCFHFHMHLVPRHKEDGLNLWYKEQPHKKKNFDALLKIIGEIK
jgi:histidine triad (HIT) family protein